MDQSSWISIGQRELSNLTDGSSYMCHLEQLLKKRPKFLCTDIEFNAEFLAKKLAVMWQDVRMLGKRNDGSSVLGLRSDAYQLQIVVKSGQYLITWIFQKGEKFAISFWRGCKPWTLIPYIRKHLEPRRNRCCKQLIKWIDLRIYFF